MDQRVGRSRLAKWSVQAIAVLTTISVVLPYRELSACACSTVVVGQGAVSSSMTVDDRTAELSLNQSDIDLPGVVPVSLTRKYMSGNGAIGIFGYGWATDYSTWLVTTSGDVEVAIDGSTTKFKSSNDYYDDGKTKRVTFTGTNEITVTAKGGEKWVFDTATKYLKEQYDRSGNKTEFQWKTEEFEFWGSDYAVFCPTKITFPGGREMTFTYHTQTGKKHLVSKVTSPSGFDVEYTYTNNLLTGIGKTNGQILSYNYHTATNPDNTSWVIGWLTEITYANGGKVEVTYNGQYGIPGKLKVTKVTGPMGYENDYTYTETEVQGQEKPNVTFVKKDSLAQETTTARTDNQTKTKVTDALGNWTESVQDANGLTTSERNRRGKTTTYTYDTGNTNPFARSNRLSSTNPLGKTWSYEYDANNFQTKTSDPLAHEVEWTYDNGGNVLTQKNGLGQTTVTNTYTTTGAMGLLSTAKNGMNNETAFTYDSFGLMIKITDPAGKETLFSYAADGSGNQTKVTNPLGKEWKKEYNGFSKVSKTIDPLANETAFEYDTMANLTRVTDAEGRVTQKSYDKLQRVTEIKDGLNNATNFTYDTGSNVTKITDALAREFTYTFDAINQTKTWVFPENSQKSYNYDANGNLTKVTLRGGQETTFSYDDADRLSGKTWVGTTNTVFTPTYDDANRLTGLTKVEGGTTISQIDVTYNAANQMTAINAEGNTASYAYDAAQRLNQITYPSSEVVKYGFNSRGLMENIKDGSNTAIADFTFDDAGRVTKNTLPNGLETVYEYNDADWVTKITLRQSATPNTVLQSFQYGYNKVGNRTWVAYADGSGDVYQYDGTDQLIGVKYGVSNPQDGYNLATGENRAVSYTYDALGNRSVMLDNLTMTNYTVNNLNQYTQIDLNNSYAYDTNGNLTNDGTWTFGYDREGHLVSANKSGTSVSYKYDALGRRIEKNVNGTVTKYVYSGQDLIEERDGSNNITAKYVYAGGIDNPVKVIRGTGAYYFQQDALGNVTALTDAGGAIVESYTYDAFGKPKIRDGDGNVISNPFTPFLFTGREYDAETGLYHYRSRAYSPVLGRFLQMDSVGFDGGDWNLYRYVSNNPTRYNDPMGASLWDILGFNPSSISDPGTHCFNEGWFRHCFFSCLATQLSGSRALGRFASRAYGADDRPGQPGADERDQQANEAGVNSAGGDCLQSCQQQFYAKRAAECCPSKWRLKKNDPKCCSKK